jgi:hypothetical protein
VHYHQRANFTNDHHGRYFPESKEASASFTQDWRRFEVRFGGLNGTLGEARHKQQYRRDFSGEHVLIFG